MSEVLPVVFRDGNAKGEIEAGNTIPPAVLTPGALGLVLKSVGDPLVVGWGSLSVAEIDGLGPALDAKAEAGHNHQLANLDPEGLNGLITTDGSTISSLSGGEVGDVVVRTEGGGFGLVAIGGGGDAVGSYKYAIEKPDGPYIEAGGIYAQATYPTLAALVGLQGDPVISSGNLTYQGVFASDVLRLAWGDNRWLAVGLSHTFTSTNNNASSWTQQSTKGARWVGFLEGVWWRCGYDEIERSSDGVSWTTVYTGGQITYVAMAGGGGKVLAVGNNRIVSTTDLGDTWAVESFAGSPNFTDVIYGAGRFVAVGGSSVIRSSIGDGNWISHTSPSISNYQFATITAEGLWVLMGHSGGTNSRAAVGVDLDDLALNYSWFGSNSNMGLISIGKSVLHAGINNAWPSLPFKYAEDGITATDFATFTGINYARLASSPGHWVYVRHTTGGNRQIYSAPIDWGYDAYTEFWVPSPIEPGLIKAWVRYDN